jgi:toxin ParE1/3/4
LAQPTILRLYDAAQSLGKFPYRGRTGQLTGTRELVVVPLPYVIVYTVADLIVHIARVLHGAQDWPGRK